MAVKLRLARTGTKKHAIYRIVAADERMPRDGRFLEKLGTYNPHTKDISLDKEAATKWLGTGAIPSDAVNKLLIKQGFDLKPKAYIVKPKKEEEAAAAK